jgi:Carboxypeptidase regulatory-like domain
MVRRLGCLLFAIGLVLPAGAANKAGTISGYVRTASGAPQMGAMVEVVGSALHSFRFFTDENGFYSAAGLVPGVYSIRVSAPTFLSQWKERIGLKAGGNITVNLTLTTLFDALELNTSNTSADEDDWKWVLRSASNRPILRLRDDGKIVAVSEKSKGHPLKGRVAFIAGAPSAGYGSAPDMSTDFKLERSVFSTGTVGLQGNVGYNGASSVLRASYKHQMLSGSGPELAFTARRLPAPDFAGNKALQALSLATSDKIVLGDVLELKFGSELQTIQFMGRLNAFLPFGSVGLHLSPNTIVEYSYTSSQPNTRMEKGFDTAPADLSESGPRVSMVGHTSYLERDHHQEISVSRRIGKNNIQLAAYTDHIKNPALAGVGSVSTDGGYVLPDLYSETFTYRGQELDTNGIRVVMQRKVNSKFTATMDYEFGGVLALDDENISLQDAASHMVLSNRHSVAAKASGEIPLCKTKWIASYRWTDGPALTPVDMFNSSPGQTDPFLSIFVRQPIPGTNFLPVRMDAVLDLRNLLAQGYVPVVGQDGQTVYLVQSARTVRGGLAFTF